MYSEGIQLKRSFSDQFDFGAFLTAVSLIAIGLISIYSATYDAGMHSYFFKQLVYAGIGFSVMLVVAFVPERWIGNAAYILYGISIIFLIAVVAFGKTVSGAQSWLVIGPISFQPSEVAKLGTILAIARYISQPSVDLRTLRDLGMIALLGGLPIVLVMMEPDFGSATVYVAMLIGIALWSGADLVLLFAIIAPPIVALISFFGQTPLYIALAVVAIATLLFRRSILVSAIIILVSIGAGFSTGPIYSMLKPHQQNRIQSFLDPNTDPKGKGYHVIQSKIAVGSGGILGKGFLKGTQTQLRYIPKQWTDFIFCVPTEEFGFLGGSVVIGLLCLLVLRCIKIAGIVRTKFSSAIAVGIGCIWIYHTMVNVGMAIGLMPVMGIPLPFLSAGGSALVINMAMVGLLLNFYRHRSRRTGVI